MLNPPQLKQVLSHRILYGLLHGLLYGLVLALQGCTRKFAPKEIVRSSNHTAAPYTITEAVQYDYSSLGDDYFRRVYVVESEGKETIRFKGEPTMWAIDTDLSMGNPKVVGEWLSIFSRGRVWIWQPGQPAVTFSPIESIDSNVWQDNQMEIPSGWDHWATDFQISDGKWILEYTDNYIDAADPSPGPEHFYFISEDQGQTFVPVVDGADLPDGIFQSLAH